MGEDCGQVALAAEWGRGCGEGRKVGARQAVGGLVHNRGFSMDSANAFLTMGIR